MPRLSANLSLLFADLPFLQRFEAAAHAGFAAVECQFPYSEPVAAIRRQLAVNGLQLVLHNLPAGDWGAGERGLACHPQRRADFRAGVEQALEYAVALGVPRLNCLAGLLPPGCEPAQARATLVTNLRHAARRLARHGLTLLLEPINTGDMPSFFVPTVAQAVSILREVGAHNLRLQYDLYHATRMGDDMAATLRQHLHRIGHVQIADVPGRHEPGSGQIAYRSLLPLLDVLGYRGHVGCEYLPRDTRPGGTQRGLCWVAAHGLRLHSSCGGRA